ncbi:hypothetical protein GCM10009754_36060 [Amycolatopsis minnesotensis]|uniref:Uncharacterized protein n=2 Tax=Amycolatopsis minnesotensis TaxID=337894 RepID=A0ABN2R209_9PSEU
MKIFPNLIKHDGGRVHAPDCALQSEYEGLRTPLCLEDKPRAYLMEDFERGKSSAYRDTDEDEVTCKKCIRLSSGPRKPVKPLPSLPEAKEAAPRLSPEALKAVPEIAEFLRDVAIREDGNHNYNLIAAATVLEIQAGPESVRRDR